MTSLPVEDPVFDAAVVVGCLVASCRYRLNHFGLPVLLDEVFQVFPISGAGIRYIVVGEPTLELGLVPFVVRWNFKSASVEIMMKHWLHTGFAKPSTGDGLGRSEGNDKEFEG